MSQENPIRHPESVPQSVLHHYNRKEVITSENASIYFPLEVPVVLKELRSINDGRYTHKTLDQRQDAQLQALAVNREFTPEAYYGLAPVVQHNKKRGEISLAKTIAHPTKPDLIQDAVYELVMKRYDTRLDEYLLHASPKKVERCLNQLVLYMADIDSNRPNPSTEFEVVLPEDQKFSLPWGHPLQVHAALMHNISYLHEMVEKKLFEQRVSALFTKRQLHVPELQDANFTVGVASLVLPLVFDDEKYTQYFMDRLNEGHIIVAHADPKPKNIFLEFSGNEQKVTSKENIKLLDANTIERYRNIDKLRNLALLLVPINVLLNSRKEYKNGEGNYLTDMMFNQYLELTHQYTKSAKAVYDVHAADIAAVGTIMECFDTTGNEMRYLYSLKKSLLNVVGRLDLAKLEHVGLRKFIFIK